MTSFLSLLVALGAGAVLGVVVMYVLARAQRAAAVAEATGPLREEVARLRAGEATHQQRLEDTARTQRQLEDAFGALSADALRRNNESFLQVARAELERTTASLCAGLSRYDATLAEIERARTESFGALAQRLTDMSAASESLRGETQKLARALRAPAVRGRWGEIQLQRVVELAGMTEHCDFARQESVERVGAEMEGGRLRPDLTVRLPNGRTIVIDAKAPLLGYLDAVDATDDEGRREALGRHARQIRAHVDALSGKRYWEQFDGASPEFVVLFLPGEMFFSAALEQEPALIEQGVEQRVILATPTTLIALLKAVAYGWRQERVTQEALAIGRLGRELYERLATLGGHFDEMGRGLERAVRAYNGAVGSYDARVMVTARRFAELGVAAPDELAEIRIVEQGLREVQSAEARTMGAAIAPGPA